MNNKRKGFTLIELLVVISIISLLSSIVLSSISVARMKARDSKRIQDLKQIQLALEMYKSDHGRYPSSDDIGCDASNNTWCLSTESSDWGLLEKVFRDGKYMSMLPIDPINKTQSVPNNNIFSLPTNYAYAYLSGVPGRLCADGSCYDLIANLEDTGSPYRNKVKNYISFLGIIPGVTWTQIGGNLGSDTSQLYSPQN